MLYTKVEEDANRSLFSLSYIKLTQFMTIKHLRVEEVSLLKCNFDTIQSYGGINIKLNTFK
jgi:hypothetical protein